MGVKIYLDSLGLSTNNKITAKSQTGIDCVSSNRSNELNCNKGWQCISKS